MDAEIESKRAFSVQCQLPAFLCPCRCGDSERINDNGWWFQTNSHWQGSIPSGWCFQERQMQLVNCSDGSSIEIKAAIRLRTYPRGRLKWGLGMRDHNLEEEPCYLEGAICMFVVDLNFGNMTPAQVLEIKVHCQVRVLREFLLMGNIPERGCQSRRHLVVRQRFKKSFEKLFLSPSHLVLSANAHGVHFVPSKALSATRTVYLWP